MNQSAKTAKSETVIVMAVDPFEDSPRPIRRMSEEICVLMGKGVAKVIPVNVRYRAWIEIPEISAAQAQSLVELELSKARKSFAKRAGKSAPGKPWCPVIVAQARGATIRAQVDALLGVARSEGADLIMTATYANRGLDRWLLGSFAETLIQRSEIPVCAVNPSTTKSRGAKRRILFATDLSSESAAAFAKVLPFARQSGAEIRLFHRFWFDRVPEPGAAYSLGSVYSQVSQNLESQTRASLAKWVEQAAAQGVKAKAVLDDNPGPVAAAILKHAAGCALIAMATQSGPVSAVVLGSATRKVLRQAKCPVWTVSA